VYRLLVNQELMTQRKEMSCFLSMSACCALSFVGGACGDEERFALRLPDTTLR
jgi:hypothetical protein